MNQNLFSAQSKGVRISATTTASASVALPNAGNSIRIVNEGPNHAYLAIGDTAQTATVPSGTAAPTCTCILSGSDVTLGIAGAVPQQFSAICGTGTAVLDVYVGEGQ